MRRFSKRHATGSCAVSVFLLLSAAQAQSRQEPAAQQQADEVVRVETELVQTDVTVVDKRGRPVEGLGREQFELRVDGRPVRFSFFEGLSAGSAEEESKLAAASGSVRGARKSPLRSDARGRVIFFYVDDLHLAPDSLARVRVALLRFFDEQMASGDRAAVVTASGQVGFLQQLTDNKAVLREAVARLGYKRDAEAYVGKVPISEVDANRIQNHRDRELFAYLVEATRNEYQMGPMAAAMMVKNRVRQINATTRAAESHTLGGLLGLMRSSAPLAGRKVVFFISDGFVVDEQKSNGPEVLRRVTQEAARVGAVVYTLDARGAFGDQSVSATRNDYPDFTTRTTGRNFFDERATKEPLQTLAEETGGRAFVNDNSFNAAFADAVAESAGYYLLAWRPESEEQRSDKSRVEVAIKGRPDLRVRARKHLFAPTTAATKPTAAGKPGAKPSAEDELRAALASLYPRRELPLSVTAGYLDTAEKGTVLTASMQLDPEMLDFGGEPAADAGGDAPKMGAAALVDVLGVAIDDRGQFATFKQVLTVSRETLAKTGQRFVVWGQQLQLPPGLYQLRVAARDRRSGRSGSQSQWVEIPAPGRLALSSLFVGELAAGASVQQKVSLNVARRFARASSLRFQTFVYGAGAGAVVVRARVVRDGRAVLTLPASTLPREATRDPARVPYSGDVPLAQLAPGRYVLEVTAEDPAAGISATQQADFVVE
jgi:VWFA-related protein